MLASRLQPSLLEFVDARTVAATAPLFLDGCGCGVHLRRRSARDGDCGQSMALLTVDAGSCAVSRRRRWAEFGCLRLCADHEQFSASFVQFEPWIAVTTRAVILAMTVHTHSLSRDEVIRFHNEGFLGPLKACSHAEMAQIRERIDREVLPHPGPDPARNEHARHLDMKVVYDLVSHPAIIGSLQSILGTNIVIWSSNFWNKEPGGAEIPWHQDINFWPIEPLVNVSSWIAIDEVTTENACVQLIPSSHRTVLPHVPAREEMAFEEEVDPDKIDLSRVINMELAPGEFFLFNERTLHHSEANRSDKRRLGLAARYTIPLVKVLDQDGPPLFPGHRCVLLTGEDQMKLNRMATAPHV